MVEKNLNATRIWITQRKNMKLQVKQEEKSKFLLSEVNPNTVMAVIFVLGLVSSAQGFCADSASTLDYGEFTKSSTKYIDFIFNPAIRKTVFGMGFGWGVINSFMKSSFMPFLTYAGLGATYNFTPSIINLLSSM